jgi:hypothetical protein
MSPVTSVGLLALGKPKQEFMLAQVEVEDE